MSISVVTTAPATTIEVVAYDNILVKIVNVSVSYGG